MISRLATIWMMMPDEAIGLLVVGLGLMTILGLVSFRWALGIIVLAAFFPVIASLIESLMALLPLWLNLLIVAAIAVSIFRALSSFVLGDRAADHMTGILAAGALRGIFRLVFLPIRLVVRQLARQYRA